MDTTINRFVWQTCIISTNKQLINVVTQSSYKYEETSEIKYISWTYMYTTSRFLVCLFFVCVANMRFKQIRPHLTRGYSQTYIYADYV